MPARRYRAHADVGAVGLAVERDRLAGDERLDRLRAPSSPDGDHVRAGEAGPQTGDDTETGGLPDLDEVTPMPKAGDTLPVGWYHIFFPRIVRNSQVGPDGHPARGDFLPPVPLPRRMFAGRRGRFLADLRVGDEMRRESTIKGVTVKQGRTGQMVFVTVQTDISTSRGLAVTEEQDIVYREPAEAGAPPPPPQPAPAQATWKTIVVPDEATRKAQLETMKRRATWLLAGAGVVFVIARYLEPRYGLWMGALRATAEASLVGGLADWFAVTALFRHPMGLPIPHTAIIPRKKDQLGESLSDFVGENFLSVPVVSEKLRSARIANRTGAWLSRRENAERVTAEAATVVRGAVAVLRDDEVQAVIDQAITRRVVAQQWGPPMGKLLEGILDGVQSLLCFLCEAGVCWLSWAHGTAVLLLLCCRSISVSKPQRSGRKPGKSQADRF